MWPLKSPKNFWCIQGESGNLPANEQRLYDAYVFMMQNMDYAYSDNDEEYSVTRCRKARLTITIKNMYKEKPIEVERDDLEFYVHVPSEVKNFLITELNKRGTELHTKNLEAGWPLPTVWKPVSKKKGK